MYFVFRGLSTMGLKGRLSGDIGELAELRSLSVYFDESMMNTREELTSNFSDQNWQFCVVSGTFRLIQDSQGHLLPG